ncbi:MAG: hypothetical protein ACXWUP_12650, partial [Allosphingosinicella sp.]
MVERRFGLAMATALLLGAPSAFSQAPTSASIAAGRAADGELTPNDSQRRSGKYEDVFTVQARRGERLDLRLSSRDFDSYLVVTGPEGFSLSNDDGESGSLDSRLVLQFPTEGAYRVAVTTFRPGETGRYRLQASAPAPDVAVTRPEPAAPIAIGASVNG